MVLFAISAVVTALLSPLVRALLVKSGTLDIPNERSSHTIPVPRGGGIACAGGIATGFLVAHIRGEQVPWLGLVAVLALATVGLIDDRRGLPAQLRLGAQLAVGAGLGFAVAGTTGVALGALVVPIVVNAVNFMDGINAITGLHIVVWGVVTAVAGALHGSSLLSLLGAVAAGSGFGFLPWNAPQARLFLGDVGSYLFGAFMSLGIVAASSEGIYAITAAAPLALYLADTGTALVRRAIRHESLTTAHREHVYQRLVDDVGMSHMGVAVLTSGMSALVAAAWLSESAMIGLIATLIIAAAYLTSPAWAARWSAAWPVRDPRKS